MSKIQNVAIAGASGLLGKPVLQELLDAGFNVTAISRVGSKSTLPPSVKVVNVDYSDAENLTSALQGQDALVSLVGSAAIDEQAKLFAAAIDAGVQRIIPSEFGCDLSNTRARKLPVYGSKVKIQDLLAERAKGSQTTYSFIYNNVFLDGAFDMGFIVDIKQKKMEIFNGGNTVYTTTPLSFVGKGVVGVLQHAEETANREVRLHGAGITQKQLLDIIQRVGSKDGWETPAFDTKEVEKAAQETFEKNPGDLAGWIYPSLKVAIFDPSYGNDFSKNNDNALLGLKELDEQEIEAIVRRYV